MGSWFPERAIFGDDGKDGGWILVPALEDDQNPPTTDLDKPFRRGSKSLRVYVDRSTGRRK